MVILALTIMSEHRLSNVTFESLNLAPELLKGVAEAGFSHCTIIQAETLPHALAGSDVAGQAQTGTGKTAAFLLATMYRLLQCEPLAEHKEGDPRALILAPTRELAVQIHRDADVLGRYTGLRVAVVYGGEGYERQREVLRSGVDILVGTPGRLIDYHKQHVFRLKGVQVAVLDEADRMFDLGFIKDIRYLLRRLPRAEKRLNMLFSATLSWRVLELAYEHMNSPTVVNTVDDKVTVDEVTQVLYHVSKEEKIALLVGLLRRMDVTRTIVFLNTKRVAEQVTDYLEGNGFHAGLLSGDVPQRRRLRLLSEFQSGQLPILVATDVAARGLHIPDVSHIFNFDLPQDAEDYVHRIGRTARLGASGDAISFACEQYVYSLAEIETYIGQKIPAKMVTDDLLPDLSPPVRRKRKRKPVSRSRSSSSKPHMASRSSRRRAQRIPSPVG